MLSELGNTIAKPAWFGIRVHPRNEVRASDNLSLRGYDRFCRLGACGGVGRIALRSWMSRFFRATCFAGSMCRNGLEFWNPQVSSK